jgi:hypothetical protein
MPPVGFKPTITVLELAKTANALDIVATVNVRAIIRGI